MAELFAAVKRLTVVLKSAQLLCHRITAEWPPIFTYQAGLLKKCLLREQAVLKE